MMAKDVNPGSRSRLENFERSSTVLYSLFLNEVSEIKFHNFGINPTSKDFASVLWGAVKVQNASQAENRQVSWLLQNFNVTITILDIIRRTVFYSKHKVSEAGDRD
jgi:hypothetical protein